MKKCMMSDGMIRSPGEWEDKMELSGIFCIQLKFSIVCV